MVIRWLLRDRVVLHIICDIAVSDETDVCLLLQYCNVNCQYSTVPRLQYSYSYYRLIVSECGTVCVKEREIENIMVSLLVKSLVWRAALKTFLPIDPVAVNVAPILEATRLAPSAFGVQPYDIHVITDPELKTQLREVSYDQAQVSRSN